MYLFIYINNSAFRNYKTHKLIWPTTAACCRCGLNDLWSECRVPVQTVQCLFCKEHYGYVILKQTVVLHLLLYMYYPKLLVHKKMEKIFNCRTLSVPLDRSWISHQCRLNRARTGTDRDGDVSRELPNITATLRTLLDD